MKDRVKDLIRVVLMVGVCIGGIFLLMQPNREVNIQIHPIPSLSESTATTAPVFLKKSAREGLREAIEYYDILFPEIVYAQAILETGHFKSEGCLRHHNLFGLYNSKAKRYCRFNHWSESVLAYKEWIQKRYKPPEDYYKFLQRIGYATDEQYIYKLKQIVNSNDKRRSFGGGEGNS